MIFWRKRRWRWRRRRRAVHADLGLGGRCMMGRVFRMMEHFGRDRCALFLPLEE